MGCPKYFVVSLKTNQSGLRNYAIVMHGVRGPRSQLCFIFVLVRDSFSLNIGSNVAKRNPNLILLSFHQNLRIALFIMFIVKVENHK